MTRAGSGRASIHRDAKRGGWEGWVSLGTDGSGRRRRKHVRGETRAEVVAKIEAIERQRAAGAVPTGPDLTLDQWLERWVQTQMAYVRPTTLSGYRTDLKHIHRSIGRVKLRQLAPEHIRQLYADIIASGCSGGTVAHVRRTLRAALNTAVDEELITRNPVRLVKPIPHRPRKPVPLDADEIGRVLAVVGDRRNGARWSLAFLGMRQGECLGLLWQWVDLDRAELRVENALTWLEWKHGCTDLGYAACGKRASSCPKRHGGGPHLGPPKSEAGVRTLALPVPVVEQLRTHHAEQAAERLAAGTSWVDREFVFANRRGGPIRPGADNADWNEVLDAAGVRRVRVHDARHSAATALLLLGADSRQLLGTFGWTSMALVQRYTHMLPELRRSVAARQTQLWKH